MNIYKRELKSEQRSLLYWILGAGFTLFASMSAFPMMENSGVDISNFMEAMPRTLSILFGMNDLDMGSAMGYHGILIYYVILAGAIYGSMLGVRLVSKEELLKTSEFLLTRPRARRSILLAKVLAGLTLVLLFTLSVYGFSLLSFLVFTPDVAYGEILIMETVSLLLIMVIFYSFGIMSAALWRKARVSSAVTLVMVLFTFILSIFHDLMKNPPVLRVLTPFRYFPLADLVEKSDFAMGFLLLSLLLILILVFASFLSYERRDMSI